MAERRDEMTDKKEIEYRWFNPVTGKMLSFHSFIGLLEGMKSQGHTYGRYDLYENGKFVRMGKVE